MSQRLLLVSVAAVGCSSSGSRTGVNVEPPPAKSSVESPACADPVLVMTDGKEAGTVCEAAVDKSTTVVDLRDAWTPKLFAPAADGTTPAFRETYLALAAETDLTGKRLPPQA